MTVKLLTEHQLEFLSLTDRCTGSSESTPVKVSNCFEISCTDSVAIIHLPEKDMTVIVKGAQ